jgi:hypothetical protein
VFKKYFLLPSLTILLAMVIFGVGQAWAANYTTYLITKNGYGKYPNINDNGEIVWMGENGKIYLYSNGKISIVANKGKYPDINNNGQITYANGQIYLYQNGITKNISNNDRTNYWPFINNNGEVVWYGVLGDSFRIYLYKDNNPFIIRDQNGCRNPRLNDLGQIVWKEFDVDGEYIFFHNGSNISKIGGPGSVPDINNDGKIVWGQVGIILYDNNTPNNIVSDGYWPRINTTGHIVYEKLLGPGPVFPEKICLYK